MDIIKASGEREPFDRDKFCRSLRHAGAPSNVVAKVCGLVEQEITPDTTTIQIQKKAAKFLGKEHLLSAARYRLRSAIMELGPAGFFFERYMAAILREYGYHTKVGQILKGKCLPHEIDILAEKDNKHYIIEAKYHNQRGIKSDAEVAMYTYARFLDIKDAHEEFESPDKQHQAWLITNTKFTTHAKRYAECKGVKMTGWRYPKGETLEELITQKSLYPVTVLPSANQFVREQFAKENVMFVRDVLSYSTSDLQKTFGLNSAPAKRLLQEAYNLV